MDFQLVLWQIEVRFRAGIRFSFGIPMSLVFSPASLLLAIRAGGFTETQRKRYEYIQTENEILTKAFGQPEAELQRLQRAFFPVVEMGSVIADVLLRRNGVMQRDEGGLGPLSRRTISSGA